MINQAWTLIEWSVRWFPATLSRTFRNEIWICNVIPGSWLRLSRRWIHCYRLPLSLLTLSSILPGVPGRSRTSINELWLCGVIPGSWLRLSRRCINRYRPPLSWLTLRSILPGVPWRSRTYKNGLYYREFVDGLEHPEMNFDYVAWFLVVDWGCPVGEFIVIDSRWAGWPLVLYYREFLDGLEHP